MSGDDEASTLEVEAKFRVHPVFELPSLVGERTGAGSADPARDEQLRAIYWDTSDLRLAREGVTLRNRSGEGPGKDGWHLKLPVRAGQVPDASVGSRHEIHAEGERDVVPEQLRDLVMAWVRTEVLGPVATLVTHRTSYLLRDDAGSPLVEVTDDVVSVLNSGHVAGRFREIEVEDRGGGKAAITAVSGVLRAAGAVGGEFVPKVIRALGPQATGQPDPPLPAPVGPDEPGRHVIRDALRRNVRAVLTHDVEVRRDVPDAVHQMRVNARRTRSLLKTFGPVLDPEWAESLRAELKWLADALAGARDNEVLLNRLLSDLDQLPESQVMGPVRSRIEKVVGSSLEAGSSQVQDTLRSERYIVLLERLVDAAWEPMTAPAAEDPADKLIPKLILAAWKKLAKRANRLEDPDASDHDWHKTRIAAKQLRYSCDAVVTVFGKPAQRLANRAEELQEVLGEHQDAVIANDTLRQMAASRGAASTAFTLGLLHARQTDAAAAARTEFRHAWAKASRPKYRRWLSA